MQAAEVMFYISFGFFLIAAVIEIKWVKIIALVGWLVSFVTTYVLVFTYSGKW